MNNGQLNGLLLEREYCSIVRDLNGDEASRSRADAYLASSPAAYHGGRQKWDFAPKIIDPATQEALRHAAEEMHGIMEDTIAKCIADPSFCAHFGLPSQYSDFMAFPQQYSPAVPLARVDVFFNEKTGDYQFCETNTDGSFGFTVADEITKVILNSDSGREFLARHKGARGFGLRGRWMRSLLRIYDLWQPSSAAIKPSNPEIAIVDYAESVERAEVDDFISRFRSRGLNARFSDVRSLRLEKLRGRTRLFDEWGPVSCVWMRVVAGALFDKPCSGSEALMEAARENLSCLIGGFRTWPVALKTFFAVLRDEKLNGFLTHEQRKFVDLHVPETYKLDRSSDLARFEKREEWIAKPIAGYNAQGVIAGIESSQESWEQSLLRLSERGGVVQRYAPQFAAPCLPTGEIDGDQLHDFMYANTMMGLFLFQGHFSGVYSRCGINPVIGEKQGRLNQGCLLLA